MTPQGLLEIFAENPEEIVVFAGGTDLMVQSHAGLIKPKRVLDLSTCSPLKEIRVTDDAISIGALATYSQIKEHPFIADEFPMLVQAARLTGALAIQNRGTLGGNIANASPAADTPPALLAYDAKLVLGSVRGEREVEYAQFHTGYKKTLRAKDELILRIVLPRRQGTFFDYYEKVGARSAQAIAKVGIAASAQRENDRLQNVRIAFSSVAPMPLRCVQTERVLEGQVVDRERVEKALAQLSVEIAPIDDIRSDAIYRGRVAQNLLGYFLREKVPH